MIEYRGSYGETTVCCDVLPRIKLNSLTVCSNYMTSYKLLIRKIPGVLRIYLFLKDLLLFLMDILQSIKSAQSPFIKAYPPGHHYSPFPDMDIIVTKWGSYIRNNSKECSGIDLREGAQIELLDELAVYYGDLSFSHNPDSQLRYYFENNYFTYADAIVLFGMLRHFRPRKVIEVGSGFSSALMLDTNDMYLGSSTEFTFVEPYPDRLESLLKKEVESGCTVITEPLQKVSLNLFNALGENDILFIDSSHVVKPYSDVMRIFGEILPTLNVGVLIHFHDICWPFEYPKQWIMAGRAWNEAYMLKAFLQFNDCFEILYFNSFMNLFHSERLKKKMPLCLHNPKEKMVIGASSIWIRKKK